MHVKPDIVPGGLANVQAGVTVKPDIVGVRFGCARMVSETKTRETRHSSRGILKSPGRSYRETGHS